MDKKNQYKTATPKGIIRCAHVENFQVVVYDDFMGVPLKVTFLNDRWWVTTEGEWLQPLEEYFKSGDIHFNFLCDVGGSVGALALAKMLGKAIEFPEDDIAKLLPERVASLKRLGVTLNVKDEPLKLKLDIFRNEEGSGRGGFYSMICYLADNYCEQLFDVDYFDSRIEAKLWCKSFFNYLESIGIDFSLVK